MAKVIAARRAARWRRLIVVRDQASGVELARYDGTAYIPSQSARQMRAADPARERPTATLTRTKIG